MKRFLKMSATFTFTGNSSILCSDFHPELEFDSKFSYSCGLLEFTAYNSIPNVTYLNNKFYFILDSKNDKQSNDSISRLISSPENSNLGYKFIGVHGSNSNKLVYYISVPTGAYELKRVFLYLTERANAIGISLQLSFDESTLTCKVKSTVPLLFSYQDSIHQLLGFSNTTIEPHIERVSDSVISISRLNTIVVECDIVEGSYTNGRRGHSVHEFAPSAFPGYKIIEVPANVIYLPINRRIISSIQIRVVDQDGKLIDFRGEQITCRIHIKKD